MNSKEKNYFIMYYVNFQVNNWSVLFSSQIIGFFDYEYLEKETVKVFCIEIFFKER